MTINVSLTIVDDYKRTGNKRFEGRATVLATAKTNADDLLADFAAITLAGCNLRTFTEAEVQSEAVETGANLDAGATIHCRLNNGKGYALKVPAIDPSLVLSDGRVDIAAPAIAAFVANFEAGGQYTVSEGNTISEVLYGELDR
jgi:hypothetical protein